MKEDGPTRGADDPGDGDAAAVGADSFGVVNSGRGPTRRELEDWLKPILIKIATEGKNRACATLGALTPEPLIVADRRRAAPTLDAEVKTLLLLPPGTELAGDGLVFERDLGAGRLFRAMKPGIFQATARDWAVFVRVAPIQKEEPYGYVGLAQYRHLEEDPDE